MPIIPEVVDFPKVDTGPFDFSISEAERSKQFDLEKYRYFQRRYRDDPSAFVRECFRWRPNENPAFYQKDAINSVPVKRRVTVRGPHGLGKSALMSWAILWFSLTRDGVADWKVPITASSWRQLTHYLMPELHKWSKRLNWKKIGRQAFDERMELQSLNLKLSTGEAFALASNNSDLIEGAHASELLYIFDESKAIPDNTWDAAEGAFSTGNAYWLACSTPGEPSGRFYSIHKREAGYEDWHVVHVTKDDAIQAGRMLPEWAESRRRQWGEMSAVYLNKVLGEFAESARDGIIPLAWIEAANERWEEWRDLGFPGRLTALGVDVGGGGEGGDKSTLATIIDGTKVRELLHQDVGDPHVSTMELVALIGRILERYARLMHANIKSLQAIVDILGIGMGVVHRGRELGFNIQGFSAGQGTTLTDKSGELGFADWRSAAWWLLREMLEPQSGFNVCLPPDVDTAELHTNLIGDLTAPRWTVTSDNKIRVESKEKMRQRIHRSTDDADAVLHGMVGPLLLEEADQADREYIVMHER